MPLPERFDDICAIEQLNRAFCHELDRGTPEGFAALFVAEAFYAHAARESHGRAEILAFARGRTAGGPRTSRHMAGGVQIAFESDDRATGISCCTTFAASALPPIATTVPILVADFADIYARDEGVWRFAARRITPIFTPAA